MKLDSMVLACLRGIGGAALVIASAGCGASAAPAAEPTTPVVVAQTPTTQPDQPPVQPPVEQVDPNTQVVGHDPEIAPPQCGRG